MNKLLVLSRWQGTDLRRHEIIAQQMIEGVTQEAVSALLEKEQDYTQQRAQDQAQAAVEIQKIKHQAQGLINEAQGAVYVYIYIYIYIYILEGARQNEQQERQRMKAEEEQDNQTRQQEQQIRRREQEIRRIEK